MAWHCHGPHVVSGEAEVCLRSARVWWCTFGGSGFEGLKFAWPSDSTKRKHSPFKLKGHPFLLGAAQGT